MLAHATGPFTAGTAFADCSKCATNEAVASSQLVPVTDKTDAAWLAKASPIIRSIRAPFPVTNLIVPR